MVCIHGAAKINDPNHEKKQNWKDGSEFVKGRSPLLGIAPYLFLHVRKPFHLIRSRALRMAQLCRMLLSTEPKFGIAVKRV